VVPKPGDSLFLKYLKYPAFPFPFPFRAALPEVVLVLVVEAEEVAVAEDLVNEVVSGMARGKLGNVECFLHFTDFAVRSRTPPPSSHQMTFFVRTCTFCISQS
jgi:hypothetical protein